MRVNTYEVDADGTERLHCTDVDLRDCFPDLDDEYYTAQFELDRAGHYWGGGGAAPLFLLMLVRS